MTDTPHTDNHGNIFPDPDTFGDRQLDFMARFIDDKMSYKRLRIECMEDGIDPFELVESLAGRGMLLRLYTGGQESVLLTDLGKRLQYNMACLNR